MQHGVYPEEFNSTILCFLWYVQCKYLHDKLASLSSQCE